MKENVNYDELAFNELMLLIKDSIISSAAPDGMCDGILTIAAKLVCNDMNNFYNLLRFAFDASPDMADVFASTMFDKYNMISINDNIDSIKTALCDKGMIYDIFKTWYLEQDMPEQFGIIKELLNITV